MQSKTPIVEPLESRTLYAGVTPGAQFALGEGSDEADAAADAHGNFVAVWTDGASGSRNVYAQRFDVNSNPLGGAILANQTVSARTIRNANVAVAADGRFVIAWSVHDPVRSRAEVFVRRFSAAGQPLGSEITTTANGPFNVSGRVAMDDEGDFNLVWKNERNNNNYDICVQRFDALGKRVGRQIVANASPIPYGTMGYFGPGGSIDMDADGDFIVTWNAPSRDGSGWGVFGQRFIKDGAKSGAEFRVNTYTGGDQGGWDNVSAGVAGDFVITWESWGQNGEWAGAYAQRYSPTGAALGGEFKVNDVAPVDGWMRPRLDVGRDGYFVIAFNRGFAQAYAPDGVSIGGNFQAGGSTPPSGDPPIQPVMQPGAQFLLTWGSGGQKFFIDMTAQPPPAPSPALALGEPLRQGLLFSDEPVISA